jgi:hypothetical protein
MIRRLLFFLLLLINQYSFAQIDPAGNTIRNIQPDRPLDIYLVIGQSNMAGRAQIREKDQAPVKGAFLFTGQEDSPWTAAANPLNLYSTVRKKVEMQRLGPAYAFAKKVKEARPGKDIGLVVNALGGTKIVQWLPGTRLYREAISQARKALKYGSLKGVIWHQGESDCDPLRVGLYLGRVEILINALREEFNDPNLPFIAGQVYENERRHDFNQMILKLPDFISNTGVVSSEGTTVFDGTHFDSESANLLGQRYAEEMLKYVSTPN